MSGQILTIEDLSIWHEYYSQLNQAGPYHHPDYLVTLAGNLEPPESVELFIYESERGDAFVYYPYFRRPLTSLPYHVDGVDVDEYADIVSSWYYGGPIFSKTDVPSDLQVNFLSSFNDMCTERGLVAEFVRFDPNLKNHHDFPKLEPIFNRETVPVDLSVTEENLWGRYEDRNQRAINQARETDLNVEHTTDSEDLSSFHTIYADAMEAKDASPHYRFERSFFQNLITDLPNLSSLLVVRYAGEVVGGFILIHDDKVGHHFLSASIPDYWDMRVNNLLYHEVLLYAKEQGMEMFDFQGGRPGVFKFKKGFSPLRGSFHIAQRIHLPEIYERLVTAASSAGLNTDNDYFPAYRIQESN